jgi:hypothetical protein
MLNNNHQQVPIHLIQSDINPKDMGVDVFQATPEEWRTTEEI